MHAPLYDFILTRISARQDVPSSSPSSFSDVEISLLKERRITEVTPGHWMHTQEQADGRIIARMRFISRNVICVGMLVRASAWYSKFACSVAGGLRSI